MPTLKFLYFDLGNVLLKFDNQRAWRQMAELSGLPADTVRAFIQDHGYATALETGRISNAQFYREYCDRLQVAPDMPALLRAASDMFSMNLPVLSLLTRLRLANQRIGLLSNTCLAHWQFITCDRFTVVPRLFEHCILSFEVGAMKPEPSIYAAAAERAGVAPAELFFTDDLPANVDAASQAGWQAVRFTDAHALAEELWSRGVEFSG